MKKVCVFVDGENFRHSIVDLFRGEFDQADYLPKRAGWTELFDWLVENALSGHVTEAYERLRTYWYVCQYPDFSPYKFEKVENEPEKIKSILSKHDEYKRLLAPLTGETLISQMKELVNDLVERRDKFARRFNGWHTIQDGIAVGSQAIEFRRAGAISLNLFTNELGKEKAVDVKLATDLIVLRDIYDIALIVSGDQDYVPAVQFVKDTGKRVVNVSFKTRSGELLPTGARRLNQNTDWRYSIPYDDLKRLLRIGTSS